MTEVSNGLQVCDLLSCVYCLLYIFRFFSFLDNLRANSSVGPENCLLQYLRVLSCRTGTTLRILCQLVCDGLRTIWRGNTPFCPFFAKKGQQEIITWGGMLTRLKECQGRHIGKSLSLTQTARFSKNRVRCVSQQHFIWLSTVKARVV